MGKRGMAPEPTHLKIIKGNPGRRPLNENEPQPAPVFTLPSPPSWMDTYAKAEWKRMGAILVRIGVLTAADLTAFSAYCSAYARWRRCEEKLIGVHKENGGYYGPNTNLHGKYITFWTGEYKGIGKVYTYTIDNPDGSVNPPTNLTPAYGSNAEMMAVQHGGK